MSVSTPELLDAVDKIRAIASCEADWRAVCTRSYYSVYGASLDYKNSLRVPGSVGKAKGVHEQHIAMLRAPQVPTNDKNKIISAKLGNLLLGIYALRVTSDYHMGAHISPQNAASCASSARAAWALMFGNATPPLPPKFEAQLNVGSSPALPSTLVPARAVLKVVK